MSLKVISSDPVVFYNNFNVTVWILEFQDPSCFQQTNSVSHLSLAKTGIPHSANLSVLVDELDFSVSLPATGRKKFWGVYSSKFIFLRNVCSRIFILTFGMQRGQNCLFTLLGYFTLLCCIRFLGSNLMGKYFLKISQIFSYHLGYTFL